MVFFWIFSVLVYTLTGGIILMWMNDILVERGVNPFDWLWAGFIIVLWPLVMYVMTFLTLLNGLWSLCLSGWKKIKTWIKDKFSNKDKKNETETPVQ